MIKNITIKNFRCFDSLKVSEFGKINLISGKNNVGKTALLEAIFLNSSPRPDTIFLLRQIRKESRDFSKALPDRTWNNFFFQQNKNNKILIEATLENEASKVIEISVDESIKNFLEDDSEQEEKEINSLFSGSESVVSVMHIKTKIDNQNSFETQILASSKALIGKDIKLPDIKDTFFVPAFLRISNRELANEFDKARFNKRDKEVLKAFQTIDSSIILVESFSIGEPNIYLTRAGEIITFIIVW